MTVAALGAVALTSAAEAAAGCGVTYRVTSQWQGGFVADVTVTNHGDPLADWTLAWQYANGQQITSGWNATVVQSGTSVTATGVAYNRSLPTAGSVTFGVQGTSGSANGPGVNFVLNGTSCTGAPSTSAAPTAPNTPSSPTPSPAPPRPSGTALPSPAPSAPSPAP
ncbi:MAG TPA: cellulose binding domain-containing protein, partial [Actinoplanes sp.]